MLKQLRIFPKLFLFTLFFLLTQCGGTAPQVSGIVAITHFETTACQPQEKILQIRNDNTDQAQRVQGVLFELGTNQFDENGNPPNMDESEKERYAHTFVPYYKIVEVTVNGKTKQVVGDLAEEIQLAPGGVMMVKVAYNPKAVTVGDTRHTTYLDVVLNGPKLGTMQIQLDGKAETSVCQPGAGSAQEFEVEEIKTVINHTSLPLSDPQPLDLSKVSGTFKFDIDEASGTVKLPVTGWPTITIPLPNPVSGISEIHITLGEDAEGTFDAGDILFDKNLTMKIEGGLITLSGITMTTGTINLTSADAPNIAGDSFTLTGAKLDADGKMVLVIAAPLQTASGSSPLDSSSVAGGVFGAEIHLKKKN